jgi:hypothetical protein
VLKNTFASPSSPFWPCLVRMLAVMDRLRSVETSGAEAPISNVEGKDEQVEASAREMHDFASVSPSCAMCNVPMIAHKNRKH